MAFKKKEDAQKCLCSRPGIRRKNGWVCKICDAIEESLKNTYHADRELKKAVYEPEDFGKCTIQFKIYE